MDHLYLEIINCDTIVLGAIYLSTIQMLKGILDDCLLAIIKEKETYDYELAEKLEGCGFDPLAKERYILY